MNQSEKVKLVARILKTHFPDCPPYKLVHVGYVIIERLDTEKDKERFDLGEKKDE